MLTQTAHVSEGTLVAVALVVIAIAIVLALVYISLHNGIVRKDNKCDNAWQNIDAQLQRRNDLIPNLVETVRGYTKHESEALASVTHARTAVTAAHTPQDCRRQHTGLRATVLPGSVLRAYASPSPFGCLRR